MTLVLGVASLLAASLGAIVAYNDGAKWIVALVVLPAIWALYGEDTL